MTSADCFLEVMKSFICSAGSVSYNHILRVEGPCSERVKVVQLVSFNHKVPGERPSPDRPRSFSSRVPIIARYTSWVEQLDVSGNLIFLGERPSPERL